MSGEALPFLDDLAKGLGGSVVEVDSAASPYRVPSYKATLPTVELAAGFARQIDSRRIPVERDRLLPIVWSPMEEADRLALSFRFGRFGTMGRRVTIPGETAGD